MKFNFSLSWVPKILSVISAIPQFISYIEAIKHSSTGAEKKKAVIDLVKESLRDLELAAGHDLVNNANVIAGASSVIDAVVAFQNILAKEAAIAI